MLNRLLKPEYVYRPRQLVRRLLAQKERGFVSATLPWGSSIRVSCDDNVGSQIVALGLYDLVVTETLWRLCDPGEIAIDIGANIGYTSFVMAHRIGDGSLRAFEPHPVLFKELQANLISLQQQGCRAELQSYQLALGPSAGELPLNVPKDFAYHRGESSLAAPTHGEFADAAVPVPVAKLDAMLGDQDSVGVIKMDVEGFEIEVLRGAERVFRHHRVRDCVFEEHHEYPTQVTSWFESHGYEVFRLDRRFSGPRLLRPDSTVPRTTWTPTNFVATIDSERLKQRVSRSGWNCLM